MKLRDSKKLNDKKTRKIIILILIILGLSLIVIGFFKYFKGLEAYDFTINITKSEDKASLNKIIDKYASSHGIKIKKIDGLDKNEKADISISKGNMEDYTPIDFAGYAFIYDKELLENLLVKGDSKALVNDLKVCTASEFSTFVEAVSKYIENGENTNIKLKATSYQIGSKKSVENLSLNGVFSFAGGDKYSYTNKLLNVAFNDYIFDSAQDKEMIFESYVDLLDLITSNLAGEFAAGVRGNDLLKNSYYGEDKAKETFMAGKALFLLAGNDDFEDLYELNAEKSERLDMIPIKMGEINEKNIPAEVYNSVGLRPESNEKAKAFFDWYVKESEEKRNSLDKAVYSYIEKDRTINFSIENEFFIDWIDSILGEEGISSYIATEEWGEEIREQILSLLGETWDNV